MNETNVNEVSNKEIYQYVDEYKYGRWNRVGVLIGINDNGVVRIGYSRVKLNSGDIFSKEFGKALARERAFNYKRNRPTHIPFSFAVPFGDFVKRCSRYFKDCSLGYGIEIAQNK